MNAVTPIPPPGPPPWPLPGNIAPRSKPPDCLSFIKKIEWCYDNSKDWYEFIYKVVEQVLTENPGLIPPSALPPGVTDGSFSAAPGEVGELRQITASGNLNNVTTAGSIYTNIGTASLQPGAWEVSYNLQILGGQVLSAWCSLNPNLGIPVASVPGNMLSYAISVAQAFAAGPAQVAALPLICPPVPINISVPTLVSFQIGAFSGIGSTVTAAPFSFTGWARRVR